MKYLITLTFSFFIFYGNTLFAMPLTKHIIVLDTHTKHTQLSIFDYQVNRNENLPLISMPYSESIATGLPDYVNAPEKAGPTFQGLMQHALFYLQQRQIDPQTVSVILRGTEDMRSLPKAVQNQLYDNVKTFFTQHYGFKQYSFETLSEKTEGLDAWLTVNYLNEAFQKNQDTLGTLQVGQTATIVSYQTDSTLNPENSTTMSVHHHTYTIFSKSFHVGLSNTRSIVNQDIAAVTCYPEDYQLDQHRVGQFNFDFCESLYRTEINKHHIGQRIPTVPDHLLVFGEAYDRYDFFQSVDHPTRDQLEENIRSICALTWDQMKITYPNLSESTLSGECGDGIFMVDVLHNTPVLRNTHYQMKSMIRYQEQDVFIDWTFGAVFTIALNDTDSASSLGDNG